MIGHALDAILGLVLIEAGGLVLWHARTGRGIPPRQLLPNLLAGFCLVLAARLALAEPRSEMTAACGLVLLLALVAHLLDLASRWRR